MTDRPDNWDRLKTEVLQRDNYFCQNCNRKGGSSGDVQLDIHHIVPLEVGGTNQRSNLVPLCKPCHEAIHHRSKAPEPIKNRYRSAGEDEEPIPVSGREIWAYELVQEIVRSFSNTQKEGVSRNLLITALTDEYGLSCGEAESAIWNSFMKGLCYELNQGDCRRVGSA